ncbi:hypothetical protein ACFWC5_12490 [Streptomyces sp. NPDC060085]|uniref:hypothetical protein n=1 Tax=Streptomyces sp. NPDC060085 TaxID=3347054 RepID=UPI0036537B92
MAPLPHVTTARPVAAQRGGAPPTWDRPTWDRRTWDRPTWDRRTWDQPTWDWATSRIRRLVRCDHAAS